MSTKSIEHFGHFGLPVLTMVVDEALDHSFLALSPCGFLIIERRFGGKKADQPAEAGLVSAPRWLNPKH